MQIGGSPYEWLEVDETGKLLDATAPKKITAALNEGGCDDLMVISHGWKGTRTSALDFYSKIWTKVEEALARRGLSAAKIAVAGVLWPAAPYQEDFDAVAAQGASGTLSVDDPNGQGDLSDKEL